MTGMIFLQVKEESVPSAKLDSSTGTYVRINIQYKLLNFQFVQVSTISNKSGETRDE